MSSTNGYLNPVTESLQPYPMEELRRIRERLEQDGKPVLDFGTGDPVIPVWQPIYEAGRDYISSRSQYPSVRGTQPLAEAQNSYLSRRHNIDVDGARITSLPTRGSKEAIFHMGLSVVGRKGRRRILYPDPGYPVYKTSTLFAGGVPTPYTVHSESKFLFDPDSIDPATVAETAAIWVNYPHNPTGATVTLEYWERLIAWCQTNDILLLADDCYVDIYDESTARPISPLSIDSKGVVSFMSLSKRSGLTGWRIGLMAGDKNILEPHARARANFGCALPEFIQAAGAVAWGDDDHVAERRRIFTERAGAAMTTLSRLGLIDEPPKATFYLWCRVPKVYEDDDVRFCLDLAAQGIVTSPSSWLGESTKGYFRMALVPELSAVSDAMQIIEKWVSTR